MKKLEILKLPCFNTDGGIQRLGETGMLQGGCCLRLTRPHWEGPEHTPFTMTLRNKCVRQAPTTLKSFVIIVLHRSDLTVGTAFSELGNIN